MSSRFVAVLIGSSPAAAPPGIDPELFRRALAEDTYEVVASLEFVTAALALHPDEPADFEAITWPGTPVVRAATAAEAFSRLRGLGAEQAAVISGDAPDLPALLIGKLFRALSRAEVAACPAGDGSLVGLAARLPAPRWLAEAGIGLDTDQALPRLRKAAPGAGAVRAGPGWHRLRSPDDISGLDPGLEGWENTRALLEGNPLTSWR